MFIVGCNNPTETRTTGVLAPNNQYHKDSTESKTDESNGRTTGVLAPNYQYHKDSTESKTD